MMAATLGTLPLPSPLWLLKTLLYATFTLHLVFMNLTVGGNVLEVVFLFKHKEKHLDAARSLALLLPYTMALAILFGVASLLFVTATYSRLFLTSVILMGGPFILVISALIAAYVLMYVQATFWERLGRSRGWLAFVIFALLGYVGFVWSNLSALMTEPARFVGKYMRHPGGWQFDLADPTVWPRLLHVLFGLIALTGLYVAILGARRLKLEPERGRWQYRSGATWFAGATIVNICIGVWRFVDIPGTERKIFIGGALFPTIVFAVGLVAAVVALACALLGINSLRPGPYLYAAASGLLLTLVSMTIIRDQARDAALKGFYAAGALPAKAQWAPIALFGLLLIAAAAACIWLIVQLRKGRSSAPMATPGLTDSGLHRLPPRDSGGARRPKPTSSGAHRLEP